MALTGIYGPVSRESATAVIRRAVDLGVDHFDTAELYGPYANEELLADALGRNINDVAIATKFGYRIEKGRIVGFDSTPSNINRSVEQSLKRLRRARIDILYQHRPDPAVPVEDVVGTMADLQRQGKVRSLGLCAVDKETLGRAQAVARVEYVQNEYSLLQRGPEEELMPALDPEAVRLVSYSPLCRGILAGSNPSLDAADYRRNDARFETGNLAALRERLRPLREVSEARSASPATVALAWLLSRRPNVLVIPGPKTIPQLETCLAANRLQLSAAEIAKVAAC